MQVTIHVPTGRIKEARELFGQFGNMVINTLECKLTKVTVTYPKYTDLVKVQSINKQLNSKQLCLS